MRVVIQAADITAGLRELGVTPDDTLYVHSGLQSAILMEGNSREEKMDAIIAGLDGAVTDGALMMPTYTYSFCAGEGFDVKGTPSTTGMLTEHFRHQKGVRRTPEPIFSSAVRGGVPATWDDALFSVRDVTCFGEQSIFALLYELDAKLLFFGVSFEFCTFLYLAEQRLKVPYRYMKEFEGEVSGCGEATHVTARYYVRSLDQGVENTFMPLAGELVRRGLAGELKIPRGPRLFSAGARAVHDVAVEQVRRAPDYLLTRGHEGSRAGL